LGRTAWSGLIHSSRIRPPLVVFDPSNDIRINYRQPVSGQTGRLFLPFDAAIGRKATESLALSLEASVPIAKDYPVYNFKTEFKVAMDF
jgi:hypothetical protein